MNVTYIHHSSFLIETRRFYYLFDYDRGELPVLNIEKPIYILSSHSHDDHYNKEIFSILNHMGMKSIKAILSNDIELINEIDVLQVSPRNRYDITTDLILTTYQSTDLGVAFLLEDEGTLIYHAGDLNDWVWEEESDSYNQQMTKDYRNEIDLLAKQLNHRTLDIAFVVLDPRQEKDYAKGLYYFMEHIPVKTVYPMHYWNQPMIIEQFLKEYPQYIHQIRK